MPLFSRSRSRSSSGSHAQTSAVAAAAAAGNAEAQHDGSASYEVLPAPPTKGEVERAEEAGTPSTTAASAGDDALGVYVCVFVCVFVCDLLPGG